MHACIQASSLAFIVDTCIHTAMHDYTQWKLNSINMLLYSIDNSAWLCVCVFTFTVLKELSNIMSHIILQHYHVLWLYRYGKWSFNKGHKLCYNYPHHVFNQRTKASLCIKPSVSAKLNKLVIMSVKIVHVEFTLYTVIRIRTFLL